jgi:putative membrane protein
MKKLSCVFMIAFAAYALQACNSGKNSGSNTDSSATTTDTTSKTSTASTTAGDSSNVTFAKKAGMGGMAEIQLSKLAQQKSNDKKIKDFAAMMVTDHTKAADTLSAIANSKNITLPTNLDADHQKKYDDLSKMSGADFDKAYVKIMVSDHQDALNLFQDEAKNGTDAQLKAFAGKVAPTIQMHLDAINKINSGMK